MPLPCGGGVVLHRRGCMAQEGTRAPVGLRAAAVMGAVAAARATVAGGAPARCRESCIAEDDAILYDGLSDGHPAQSFADGAVVMRVRHGVTSSGTDCGGGYPHRIVPCQLLCRSGRGCVSGCRGWDVSCGRWSVSDGCHGASSVMRCAAANCRVLWKEVRRGNDGSRCTEELLSTLSRVASWSSFGI